MKLKWPQTGTLADAAIVVIALAMGVQVALAIMARGRLPTPTRVEPPPVPEYRVNESLPSVGGVDFASAERTLFMFLRSTCKFCTESMPFYGKLVTARRASKSKLRVLALSPETRGILEDYLKAHGLSVDGAISLTQDEYRQLRVRGTPTLILTDQAGVIRRLWVGRIRPELEEAVLADLLASQ